MVPSSTWPSSKVPESLLLLGQGLQRSAMEVQSRLKIINAYCCVTMCLNKQVMLSIVFA
jgi:hypothetical protein